MYLKIFRVVWFVSILAVMGVFMYVYASLPDPVVVLEQPEYVTVGKESFFYVMLGLIAIFNAFVYIFRSLRRHEEGEGFVTWFYGLVICLNIFFIVACAYVSLFNSGEAFDYSRIGVIIYGAIFLILAWIAGGIIWSIAQKFIPKKSLE